LLEAGYLLQFFEFLVVAVKLGGMQFVTCQRVPPLDPFDFCVEVSPQLKG